MEEEKIECDSYFLVSIFPEFIFFLKVAETTFPLSWKWPDLIKWIESNRFMPYQVYKTNDSSKKKVKDEAEGKEEEDENENKPMWMAYKSDLTPPYTATTGNRQNRYFNGLQC